MLILLPAARADMLRRHGRLDEAADCYQRALGQRCTEPNAGSCSSDWSPCRNGRVTELSRP